MNFKKMLANLTCCMPGVAVEACFTPHCLDMCGKNCGQDACFSVRGDARRAKDRHLWGLGGIIMVQWCQVLQY